MAANDRTNQNKKRNGVIGVATGLAGCAAVLASLAYWFRLSVTTDVGQFIGGTMLVGRDVDADKLRAIAQDASQNVESICFQSRSKLLKIANGTFSGCKNLEGITIPGTVEEIGDEAFTGCSKLVNVDMPGVKVIGEAAFRGCVSLRDIVIPSGVVFIGKEAFGGCSNLYTVRTGNVPPVVASLGKELERGATGRMADPMYAMRTAKHSEKIEALNGVALNFDVPPMVGEGAFAGCGEIKEVLTNYPDSLAGAFPSETTVRSFDDHSAFHVGEFDQLQKDASLPS
jgi:hypothetical protein